MRFFINAQIQLDKEPVAFNVHFVVGAPNAETAFNLAHEYLINDWYADHYADNRDFVASVIVHDIIAERLTAEQTLAPHASAGVVRRMTRARIAPRCRKGVCRGK